MVYVLLGTTIPLLTKKKLENKTNIEDIDKQT